MKIFLHEAKNYTQSQFLAFVKTLHWTMWKPKFITLHNTAAPTLPQWLSDKTNANHEQRIANLVNLYKNIDHWHSGPHLFIGPEDDGIWNMCDLTQDGVSVSCWNHITLGIEMVGNYATPKENTYKDAPPIDSWASADAQKVKANAVYAMAVMHKYLGLEPAPYVEGEKGLHFHRECHNDGHNCPGGQVDKAALIAEIQSAMKAL
jgi:hypothetical protein